MIFSKDKQGKDKLFAVGHLALGYLAGKFSSKLLGVNMNISFVLLLSLLPDIDMIIPGLEHRGPTHSIVICTLVFLPAFMIYNKRVIPYFASLAQHSLIGDLMTGGGVQILWPLTTNWYGAGIEITNLTNIILEWIVFLTALTIMLKTKDLWKLFQHHPSNLLLTIPALTVILPVFLRFPVVIPVELVIPHLVYLALFTLSILTDLKTILQRKV
jgi:membrane-bound metal-dependent hydrolase YbcI (DUF457 family)